MKPVILNCKSSKWTQCVTHHLTNALAKAILTIFLIAVVGLLLMLLYYFYKRGIVCSVIDQSNEEPEAAQNTTQIIKQLLSLWKSLVSIFTASNSAIKPLDVDMEILCRNSYVTKHSLSTILLTHLTQDMCTTLETSKTYFMESFKKISSEKVTDTVFYDFLIISLCAVSIFALMKSLKKYMGSHKQNTNLCSSYIDDGLNHKSLSSFVNDKSSFNTKDGSHLNTLSLSSYSDDNELVSGNISSVANDTASFHKKSSRLLPHWLLHWFLKIVICAFSLSIMWEFVRLYQSKVAERAAAIVKGIPADCDPHSMSVYQSLKEFLRRHFSWAHGADACNDYYYALLVDPLWDVSPLMVISSVLSQGLLYPLELTCSSFGRGVRFFFQEIPSQWQLLILVIGLFMSLLTLLMLCRYRVHVPLLFKLEPVTPPRNISLARRKKKRW
ncbi:chloride channel clic-like protein 1 [Biomphalaria glabrata]|nr:hypothetical protein BgiMline_029433 [Biomphalaria glabrata]